MCQTTSHIEQYPANTCQRKAGSHVVAWRKVTQNCQIWRAVPWSRDVCLTRDLAARTFVNRETVFVSQHFITHKEPVKSNMQNYLQQSKVKNITLIGIVMTNVGKTEKTIKKKLFQLPAVEQELIKTSVSIKIPVLWQVNNQGSTFTGWRIEWIASRILPVNPGQSLSCCMGLSEHTLPRVTWGKPLLSVESTQITFSSFPSL